VRQLWDDAFLLILALAAILALRGAAAAGVAFHGIDGTGVAWLQRSTWQPAVSAAALAGFLAAIAVSQRLGGRGLRAIGFALVAAGAAAAVFLHPALAGTVFLAGGHLLRRQPRRSTAGRTDRA
jgi:Na+/melibiose symporter-like transporter